MAYSWKKKSYFKFQIQKTNDKIKATLINSQISYLETYRTEVLEILL